jgi:hypothetical protein
MSALIRDTSPPTRVQESLLQYRDRGSSMSNYILRGGVTQPFSSDNGVLSRVLGNVSPPVGTLYMQSFPSWPWNGTEWIPFQKTGERFPAGAWRKNSIVETATIRDDEMVTETWRIVPLTDVMANDPAGAIVSWGYDFVDNLIGRGFGIGNLGVWVLSSRSIAPAYGSPSGPLLTGPVSSSRRSSSNGNGKIPWWAWVAGLFFLVRR